MLRDLECRLLSANPLVAMADGFVDEAACSALIALAEGRMERATVLSSDTGTEVSERRTNSDCELDAKTVPEVMPLMERLGALVGMPVSHGEPLSVLRYETSQEFKVHADGIWSGYDADVVAAFEQGGGQRLFSTMVYLNSVEGGGGTAFPRLDLRVAPQPGRLLVFANTPAGDRDQTPLAAHAGEPVTAGEKWVAVTWWRERPCES